MAEDIVPEGDAVEQDRPVAPPTPGGRPDTGIEVPEADAIEQALPGPLEDEDEYPHQ